MMSASLPHSPYACVQWSGWEIGQYGTPRTFSWPNMTAAGMKGKLSMLQGNMEQLYFLPGAHAVRACAVVF